MKNVWRAALLSLTGLVLTGCTNLSGTWRLHEVVPTSAQDEFKMHTIHFGLDGSYTAEVSYGAEPKEVAGTYEYDRETEVVTFKGESGKTRNYHLHICGRCGKMSVWNVGEQKDWEATLKRK